MKRVSSQPNHTSSPFAKRPRAEASPRRVTTLESSEESSPDGTPSSTIKLPQDGSVVSASVPGSTQKTSIGNKRVLAEEELLGARQETRRLPGDPDFDEDLDLDYDEVAGGPRHVGVSASQPLMKRARQSSPIREERFAATQLPTEDVDAESEEERVVPGSSRVNELPPPGVLLKLKLVNFMCHENFEMTPGKAVNLISGPNGSGKSALVTGLQMALGVKSSLTGRGDHRGGLVGPHADQAIVRVEIANSGTEEEGAYRPEAFGSKIIVERTLGTNGGSGKLSIKNERGKEVGNRREDVARMLSHFNIQIANPMCVQMQNQTRDLLVQGTPEQFYAYFMAATQLEPIVQQMAIISRHVSYLDVFLKSRMENIVPDLREDLVRAERKYKESERSRTLLAEVEALRLAAAWALTNEEEQVVEETNHELEKARARMENQTGKTARVLEQLEALKTEGMELRDKANVAMARLKQARATAKNAEARMTKQTNSIGELKAEIKSTAAALSRSKSNLKRTVAELEAYRAESGARVEQRQLEVAANRTRLTSEMNEVRTQMKELQRKQVGADEDVEATRLQAAEANNRLNACNNLIDETRLSIAQAKKLAEGDPYAFVGGNKMERLIEFVGRAVDNREFEMPPVGPLVRYVTVKKEHVKWCSAIQSMLRKHLGGFIVKTPSDASKMRELAIRAGLGHTVLVMRISDDAINRGGYVPKRPAGAAKMTLLWDALEITDPAANAALLEFGGADKMVLLNSDRESNVMLKGGVIPRALTPNSFIQAHDQGSALVSNYLKPLNKFLDRDLVGAREALAEIQASLVDTEAQLAPIQREVAAAQLAKEAAESNSNDLSTDLANIRVRFNRMQVELENLPSALDMYEDADEAKLVEAEQRYTDAVNKNEMRLTQLNQQLAVKSEELEEVQEAHAEAMLELEEADSDEVRAVQKRFQVVSEKLMQVSEKNDAAQQKLHELEATINHYEEQLNIHVTNAQTFHQHAQALGPETDVPKKFRERAATDLTNSMAGKQKAYENEQRRKAAAGPPEDVHAITAHYQKVKAQYQKVMEAVDAQVLLLRKLRRARARRRKVWTHIHLKLRRTVSVMFNSLLGAAEHSGELSFHAGYHPGMDEAADAEKEVEAVRSNGQLHVNVTLRGAVLPEDKCKPQTIQTLSGGERSFTGTCLMIALWSVMESPFVIVDEFDIFMDVHHRRLAMHMYMNNRAGLQARKQFFFLSPGDMSVFQKERTKDTVLHQLHPPRNRRSSLAAR